MPARISDEELEQRKQDYRTFTDFNFRVADAFWKAVLENPDVDILCSFDPYGNKRATYAARTNKMSMSRMILYDLDGYELDEDDLGDLDRVRRCHEGVAGLLREYIQDAAEALAAYPELLYIARDGQKMSIGGLSDSGILVDVPLGDAREKAIEAERKFWDIASDDLLASCWGVYDRACLFSELAGTLGTEIDFPEDIAVKLRQHSREDGGYDAVGMIRGGLDNALAKAADKIAAGGYHRPFDGKWMSIISDEELPAADREHIEEILSNVRKVYALGDLYACPYRELASVAHEIAGSTDREVADPDA